MQIQRKFIIQLVLVTFGIIIGFYFTGNVLATTLSKGNQQPPIVIIPLSGQIKLGNVGEYGVIVEAISQGNVVATAKTDSQGQYTLNVTDPCVTLRPRKGVFEFSPPTQIPCVGVRISDINFAMHRPPIIIIGGLTPFTSPQPGCPQKLLDGSSYNPGACGEKEFDRLLAELRSEGWKVQTVMMNSSLLRSSPICFNWFSAFGYIYATNPSALQYSINQMKAATGSRKVIILAHGLGGLVARCYIEGNHYAGDVSHLFTFGTPHTGQPIQDTATIWLDTLLTRYLEARQPDGDYLPRDVDDMVAFIKASINSGNINKVNFLCDYATEVSFRIAATSRVVHIPSLRQGPLCQTSGSGMASFNLSFRPRKGVQYHLLHSRNLQSEDLSGFGQRMSAAIPGSDDGLILTSGSSAFTLNGPHDLVLTRDPHMIRTSANTLWYLNTNGAFDSAFACIKLMFLERRLSVPNCSVVSSTQDVFVATPSATLSAEEEALLLAKMGITTGELVEQKTLLRSTLLTNTTTEISQPVQIVDQGSALFLASWLTGTINFSLAAPNGTVITPTGTTDNVRYLNDGIDSSYHFSNTVPGTYTITLQASEVPTSGVVVNYFASMDSEYTLTAARSRNWVVPGKVITITAVFTGPTEIQEPTVTAFVYGSNNMSNTITLQPIGNGNYQYVYTAPDAPGYLSMEIIGEGKVNGVKIERNHNLAFMVCPDSFKPNGVYTETVDPFGLTVQVGISVTQGITGNLRVTGILVAGDGTEVAVATTFANAPSNPLQDTLNDLLQEAAATATTISVPLFFAGTDLYEAGKDGPFVLRRLLVVDERDNTLVSADEANVFVTSAIDVDRFANLLFLPVATR